MSWIWKWPHPGGSRAAAGAPVCDRFKPKSETRNPRSERNPKPEARKLRFEQPVPMHFLHHTVQTHFGLRISILLRLSRIRIPVFGLKPDEPIRSVVSVVIPPQWQKVQSRLQAGAPSKCELRRRRAVPGAPLHGEGLRGNTLTGQAFPLTLRSLPLRGGAGSALRNVVSPIAQAV